MEEYKYRNKLDIELEDRLTGVGKDDFTYNFLMSDIAAFISQYINIDIAVKITIKDLGTSNQPPEELINILPPFTTDPSEIVIFKKNDTTQGNQLYLFLLPAGSYGSGQTQITANDILEIEREYYQVIVDDSLSDTSENALQNKVIDLALSDKASLSEDNTFNGTNTFTGNVTVIGEFIRENITDVDISDNVILINKGEQGNGVTARYAGIQIDRGTAQDFAIIYDEETKTLKSGDFDTVDGILQDATSTTVTLDANDTAPDNFYNNKFIKIFKANETSITASILSYVSSTKIATLQSPLSVIPDNTWNYRIVTHDDTRNIPNIANYPTLANDQVLYWNNTDKIIESSETTSAQLTILAGGSANADALHSHSYTNLEHLPIIDVLMSDISTNAVENNIIKTYIDTAIGNIPAVNLSLNQESYQVTIQNTGGDDVIIPAASTTLAGIMQANDKIQLSKIGLLEITEGSNTGYRRADADPLNYGDIGSGAIDLSFSSTTSTVHGATGNHSHAEGYETQATGNTSHAEGQYTKAIGIISHTEGLSTQAIGDNSHAEGRATQADGENSHSEGLGSHSFGYNSHAEGYNAYATGDNSHAEGYYTAANGIYSHASGNHTISGFDSQTVIGVYNLNNISNLFEVGNGESPVSRNNAFTVQKIGGTNIPLGSEYKIGGVPLSLGDLGFTGDANANYITNNNQLTNGAGYITNAALDLYLPKTGGVLDNGTSTNLTILSDDDGESVLELRGGDQGTGRLFVGQSPTYGGGILYNGDGSPVYGDIDPDYITLYRVQAGTPYWTARNNQASENWEFRGEVKATVLIEGTASLSNKYANIHGSISKDFSTKVLRIHNDADPNNYVVFQNGTMFNWNGIGSFDLPLNQNKTILAKPTGEFEAINFREGSTLLSDKYANINGDQTEDFIATSFNENGTLLLNKYASIHGSGLQNFSANFFSANQIEEGGVSISDKYAKINGDVTEDFDVKLLQTYNEARFYNPLNTVQRITIFNGTLVNYQDSPATFIDLPLNSSSTILAKPNGELQALNFREGSTLLAAKYAKINGDVTEDFVAKNLTAYSNDGLTRVIAEGSISGIRRYSGGVYVDLPLNYDGTILAKPNGEFEAKKLKVTDIPTSISGLISGQVWSDGGTLKIIS